MHARIQPARLPMCSKALHAAQSSCAQWQEHGAQAEQRGKVRQAAVHNSAELLRDAHLRFAGDAEPATPAKATDAAAATGAAATPDSAASTQTTDEPAGLAPASTASQPAGTSSSSDGVITPAVGHSGAAGQGAAAHSARKTPPLPAMASSWVFGGGSSGQRTPSSSGKENLWLTPVSGSAADRPPSRPHSPTKLGGRLAPAPGAAQRADRPAAGGRRALAATHRPDSPATSAPAPPPGADVQPGHRLSVHTLSADSGAAGSPRLSQEFSLQFTATSPTKQQQQQRRRQDDFGGGGGGLFGSGGFRVTDDPASGAASAGYGLQSRALEAIQRERAGSAAAAAAVERLRAEVQAEAEQLGKLEAELAARQAELARREAAVAVVLKREEVRSRPDGTMLCYLQYKVAAVFSAGLSDREQALVLASGVRRPNIHGQAKR